MEGWLSLFANAIPTIIIGIIGFFIKRTLTQFEQQMKEQKAHLEKQQADQKERVDELDKQLNEFIQKMPYQFTLRDDFIRAVAGFDSKLDKILDRLNQKTE